MFYLSTGAWWGIIADIVVCVIIFAVLIQAIQNREFRAAQKKWQEERDYLLHRDERLREEAEQKRHETFEKAKKLKKKYLRSDLTKALIPDLERIRKIPDFKGMISVDRDKISFCGDEDDRRFYSLDYKHYGFENLPTEKGYAPEFHEWALAMAINELLGNEYVQKECSSTLIDKKKYVPPKPAPKLRKPI